MKVLILQHIACEPPGVYEDVLRERGAELSRVEVDEGDELPDWRDVDAIVAMGGPMGTYDEDSHPWLQDEKRLLRDAVRAGTPYFGACLGAQLLADCLGAPVFPGPSPEVGVLPVELTSEGRRDPVTDRLPGSFPTLQWHGDTFELPEGAVRLASSPAYLNQAFRWGPVAYGVQFHLEVTESLAVEWSQVPAYAEALERVRGTGAFQVLLDQFAEAAPQMQEMARRLFSGWLDHLSHVGPLDPTGVPGAV